MSARQWSTSWRRSLMIGVGLYSCAGVESPWPVSRTKLACLPLPIWCFGFGIGETSSAFRRRWTIRSVGRPSGVELPVRPGLDVGGVQDGRLEEGGHCRSFLSRGADSSRQRSVAQTFAAVGGSAWLALTRCVAADFVATEKLQETDGKPTPISRG